MNEYHILVVKMVLYFSNNNSTKVNFELLCDIETLYRLAILLPLLEELNNWWSWPKFKISFLLIMW
jgi:hypothetical protein